MSNEATGSPTETEEDIKSPEQIAQEEAAAVKLQSIARGHEQREKYLDQKHAAMVCRNIDVTCTTKKETPSKTVINVNGLQVAMELGTVLDAIDLIKSFRKLLPSTKVKQKGMPMSISFRVKSAQGEEHDSDRGDGGSDSDSSGVGLITPRHQHRPEPLFYTRCLVLI